MDPVEINSVLQKNSMAWNRSLNRFFSNLLKVFIITHDVLDSIFKVHT